jgi:two-component system chemotaxis response regulator CheB
MAPPGALTLLVIGTSTGGPQALSQLFRALPENPPFPIAIALHIPAGYTASLSARISLNSKIPMKEASHGERLLPGRAYIAPGGKHLTVVEDGLAYLAGVGDEPADSVHHPSVNVLFTSAAVAAGAGCFGVILTGMGNDGTEGCRAIREAGGRVLAEAESSCVVYGMPRSVVEANLANAELPLEKIPGALAALY